MSPHVLYPVTVITHAHSISAFTVQIAICISAASVAGEGHIVTIRDYPTPNAPHPTSIQQIVLRRLIGEEEPPGLVQGLSNLGVREGPRPEVQIVFYLGRDHQLFIKTFSIRLPRLRVNGPACLVVSLGVNSVEGTEHQDPLFVFAGSGFYHRVLPNAVAKIDRDRVTLIITARLSQRHDDHPDYKPQKVQDVYRFEKSARPFAASKLSLLEFGLKKLGSASAPQSCSEDVLLGEFERDVVQFRKKLQGEDVEKDIQDRLRLYEDDECIG
mmetsp:Transcript_5773/g.12709  ORF Transcript_5773/g.12709 Transcript_5773/m.12709 type:complete len:270 (-) Transcript_5773:209-1018(-)